MYPSSSSDLSLETIVSNIDYRANIGAEHLSGRDTAILPAMKTGVRI